MGEKHMWLDHIFILSSFPLTSQIIELHAVATVFEMLKNQAFNLYTDSQYIAHGLQLLEIVPFLILLILKFCNYLQVQLNLRELNL